MIAKYERVKIANGTAAANCSTLALGKCWPGPLPTAALLRILAGHFRLLDFRYARRMVCRVLTVLLAALDSESIHQRRKR